jgi:hypothetical protein
MDGGGFSTPFRVCGNFTFDSVGTKTIRLMYEMGVGGTVLSSSVSADRSGASGQRDVHFTIYPLRSYIQAPLIVGGVTSPSPGATVMATANLNCDGSSAIIRQDGSWISSIGNIATGDCAIVFPAGVFSGTPNCFATVESGVPDFILGTNSVSATGATITCLDGAGVDCTAYTFNFQCVGPK